ncbi:mechanosensitive ion channel family protein [Pedobacter sp. SYP-B3415]|uniref:mechanosensitive ion channel family protein n=1 Tax=Pedobacter sp. SYP-B3415 TaxID=2496641 RepID=UPI00101D1336|nr:mechanosensitive ion channel domain-containing protein [Pedobacter sp. SYP-B3415]
MDVNKLILQVQTWLVARGPAFLMGMGVLFAGLWFIKVLSRWLHGSMERRSIDPSLKPFLLSLSVTVLRVLLVIAVMQIIGIEMTIFAAILGALGVAAGLALSGTLQNFASGVIILFLKPFSVGDNIIAQGQEGTVKAIKIFYTIVTTFDNRVVVFPNSKLSNEVIINISREGRRRLDIEIKFTNAIDFEAVKNIMEETARKSADIIDESQTRIGISAIEPDGYKVMLNVWLSAHGYVDGKLRFQQQLVENLRNSGLKLPGMG